MCVITDVLFRHPNLIEVRTVPGKADIAFIEYIDEDSATLAKEALHNYKIDNEYKIKVSVTLVLSALAVLPR